MLSYFGFQFLLKWLISQTIEVIVRFSANTQGWFLQKYHIYNFPCLSWRIAIFTPYFRQNSNCENIVQNPLEFGTGNSWIVLTSNRRRIGITHALIHINEVSSTWIIRWNYYTVSHTKVTIFILQNKCRGTYRTLTWFILCILFLMKYYYYYYEQG